MAMFDDMFDEFPLHHSLRIPPLLDPLPFLSAPLDRPSPLEPNARVNANIDNETAKLTGRRKALAEAKSLGDSEAGDLRPLQKGSGNDLRPIQKSPRKRQKLYDHEHIADFVQLPKPKAAAKEDKLPPFQPVSTLNQLHEPPPSAALFPPITPGTTSCEQGWQIGTDAFNRDLEEAQPASAKPAVNRNGKKDKPLPKRVCLRPQRMKWTTDEINQLVKGVAIYGMGKWKKILNHPEFNFQKGRTPVDLKDRFRTCFPQKDSDKHRAFANELSAQPYDSSDCTHDLGVPGRVTGKPGDPPLRLPRKRKPQVSRSPGPNRKRARRKPWSAEEDAALREGYRQYGFQWTVIAKDPTLGLIHRSGNQVRDRFRLKYAHLYGTASSAVDGNSNSESATARGNSGNMNDDDGDRASIDESDFDSASDEEYHEDSFNPKGVAKHSVTAPFDITNILNDEDEDNRPSASLRYDGWGESVTLPPLLLWEDMATRPMFDLE